MEIGRNLLGFLASLWVAGLIIAISTGLGIRFGLYGWRQYFFAPGEEVVFLTGKNEGTFCETVMLQSSGFITGQNVFIRDWNSFEKLETEVEQLDVRLDDKYYYLKKYRLYTNDWLDIRICSEHGLRMFIVDGIDAFFKLKSGLEQGTPYCTDNPSVTDPICGKTIQTFTISGSRNCEWALNEQWKRAVYLAKSAGDLFIILSSDPLQNHRKNLLKVSNMGKTYRTTATDLISECIHQSMCMFAFDFAANQAVVVKIGTTDDDPTIPVEIWTYCKSRDWFFVLLFCICPVVILSGVSFCLIRKFSARHTLSGITCVLDMIKSLLIKLCIINHGVNGIQHRRRDHYDQLNCDREKAEKLKNRLNFGDEDESIGVTDKMFQEFKDVEDNLTAGKDDEVV